MRENEAAYLPSCVSLEDDGLEFVDVAVEPAGGLVAGRFSTDPGVGSVGLGSAGELVAGRISAVSGVGSVGVRVSAARLVSGGTFATPGPGTVGVEALAAVPEAGCCVNDPRDCAVSVEEPAAGPGFLLDVVCWCLDSGLMFVFDDRFPRVGLPFNPFPQPQATLVISRAGDAVGVHLGA